MHVPQLPPHPFVPQFFPVQFGWHVVMHCPVVLHVCPVVHLVFVCMYAVPAVLHTLHIVPDWMDPGAQNCGVTHTPNILHVSVPVHVPQLPSHPFVPQFFPVQFGWHVVMFSHVCVAVLHVCVVGLHRLLQF